MSRFCRQCALGGRCRGRVQGVGPVPTNVMAVGQAPGWYEDKHGVPFVHDSGQFLSNTLDSVGIVSRDVFYTNLCKCFPGRKGRGDAAPPTWAVKACWPQLEEEIISVCPKLIIAVGTVAAAAFGISGGIHQTSGKLHETEYGLVVPILHPAGLMRRMSDVPKFSAQLRAVYTYLNGGHRTPPEFTPVGEWRHIYA